MGNKKELYYPVEKIQAKEILPEIDYLSNNDHFILVQMPNGRKLLVNNCSETYGLLSCQDIFPLFEEELKKIYDFESQYAHFNYSKFYIEYLIKYQEFLIGNKNDILEPKIKIHHSYDGQTKFHLYFGFCRKIDGNDLFGKIFEKPVMFKHTIKNLNLIVEESMESIKNFISKIEENVKDYSYLANICLEQDIEEYVLEISEAVSFPKNMIGGVIERIRLEKNKSLLTCWLIYNGFLYQLKNYGGKMFEETKLKIDKKIFKYIINNF